MVEFISDNQNLLELAIEAANIGIFEVDYTRINEGRPCLKWNGHHERIFGLAPGSFDGRSETFRSMVNPTDLERLLSSIQQAVLSHGKYQVTCRIRRKDGVERYVTGYGKAIYDDFGNPLRLIGTAIDSTELWQAYEEAKEQRARAEASDASKGQLLLRLSDSLRTPLSLITGFTDLALGKEHCPPEVTDCLKRIDANARELLTVVDSLAGNLSPPGESSVRLEMLPTRQAWENPGSLPLSQFAGILAGTKVLLVDDCAELRLLFGAILGAASAEVCLGEDGVAALESCREFQPDLILIDMKMPRLDGYETVPILRQRGFNKPIIAVTAHAFQSEREKCLAIGCTDYLSKPISAGLLVGTVASYVNQPQHASVVRARASTAKDVGKFMLQ